MRAAPDKGEVAAYIPELGCIDPNQFGLAIWRPEEADILVGDADTPFSIQSISKVFTLTRAMAGKGDALWARVGFEPSGDPFNSIVQLEAERGKPRNPLINAGAIVVADCLLAGRSVAATLEEITEFVRQAAGDESIAADPAVAASEMRTGQRNRALANFMAAEGNLHA
ncbi:MAG: glutaminase, partial [Pseudomonadota bacterium]